jgi:pre-mRNA-splicing factor SPF27
MATTSFSNKLQATFNYKMSEAPEIFDSLPYYDDDLEKFPFLKQKVEQEFAREPKPPQALHPRVPPAITLFAVSMHNIPWRIMMLMICAQNNPMLEAELVRVESHRTLPPLDTIRYQLPAPTSTPGTDEEWQAALKNAHAQLEHQRIRCAKLNLLLADMLTIFLSSHTNLALLQTYGPNAWRIHNYLLEETAKQSEKALEELKQLTVDINRERKNNQVSRVQPLSAQCLTAFTDTLRSSAHFFRDTVDRAHLECPTN